MPRSDRRRIRVSSCSGRNRSVSISGRDDGYAIGIDFRFGNPAHSGIGGGRYRRVARRPNEPILPGGLAVRRRKVEMNDDRDPSHSTDGPGDGKVTGIMGHRRDPTSRSKCMDRRRVEAVTTLASGRARSNCAILPILLVYEAKRSHLDQRSPR